MKTYKINDMLVIDEPPLALGKALLAIATVLHPGFDLVVTPGKSKESCVLSSLAVRDFLWQAGFKDACVTTVYLVIQAIDADENEIHSVGVGDHDGTVPSLVKPPPETDGRWSGHMVVEVPSAGYIIDTTLYPAIRPQWSGLPGMVAIPIMREGRSHGLEHLSTAMYSSADGSTVYLWWLQQPNKRWRGAPDTQKGRRVPVVNAMCQMLQEIVRGNMKMVDEHNRPVTRH